MRLFSEEQKTGTIELILTKPISEIELIIAKIFKWININNSINYSYYNLLYIYLPYR